MKLHRYGDTVVVTGATREKGTEKGKPFSHQGRFTDTWIKKEGQWLCVASQLSLIGKLGAVLDDELTQPMIRSRSEPQIIVTITIIEVSFFKGPSRSAIFPAYLR